MRQVVLGLAFSLASVSAFIPSGPRGFSSSTPSLLGPAPAIHQVPTAGIRSRPAALSLQGTASARPLDPMELIYDKANQDCPFRPYKTKEENGGLVTATFALG
mmetsp:Transcript_44752/g.70064  ORF Transcript_44752/g.70064 Transcript_44752/m.70064 type:complete len:103 (-) Transcript_44752:3105-3413(-)